ncbi:hypothetical protein QQ045_018794 [Rhodiola kirilowii]
MSNTNSQTITIKVDLSCCQECVQRMKRLLRSFKGVESISVDAKSGTVVVSGHIDQPNEIVDKIRQKGKTITSYSIQYDDNNQQDQTSTKLKDQHYHESKNESEECIRNGSQRQSPVADLDDHKCKDHCHENKRVFGESSSQSHRPPCAVDHNKKCEEEQWHEGITTSQRLRPVVYDNDHKCRVHSGQSKPYFCSTAAGANACIGGDDHQGYHHSWRFCDRSNVEQGRYFYAGEEVVEDHGHGHSDYHFGRSEWNLYDNHSSDDLARSFSNNSRYCHGTDHRVHFEGAHNFQAEADFDCVHYNYRYYPEMMSHYVGQIPRQQFPDCPVDFVTGFFSDDNPLGCWIM